MSNFTEQKIIKAETLQKTFNLGKASPEILKKKRLKTKEMYLSLLKSAVS